MFGEILFFFLSPSPTIDVDVVVNVRSSTYSFTYGAYVLHEMTEIKCLRLACFADHYPLGIYHLKCESVVIMRHQLLETD